MKICVANDIKCSFSVFYFSFSTLLVPIVGNLLKLHKENDLRVVHDQTTIYEEILINVDRQNQLLSLDFLAGVGTRFVLYKLCSFDLLKYG